MVGNVIKRFSSQFSSEAEARKFYFLGAIFFCIISVYWGLRPIKDSLFMTIVGSEWLPTAKIVSLFFLGFFISVYTALAKTVKRHHLFYGYTLFYAITAFVFMICFFDIRHAIFGTQYCSDHFVGWAWYIYVESFGVLMVALFWSFTTDITTPESAIKGFPVIAFLGQLGNLCGPVLFRPSLWHCNSSAPVVGLCGVGMLLVGVLFTIFMRTTPVAFFEGYDAQNSVPVKSGLGLLDGLRFLFTQPYLLGIMFIVFMYEMLVIIYDNHFKQAVALCCSSEVEMATYLGSYAYYIGLVSVGCLIVGGGTLQKRLGMTYSLFLLPLLIMGSVVVVYWYPHSLTTTMLVMVFLRAVNYTINQPLLKQLYIPTSSDTKYRAQVWLEAFGSRGSKAFGSFVNMYRVSFGVLPFITFISIGAVGCVVVWMFVAAFVARVYTKAIVEKRIIC